MPVVCWLPGSVAKDDKREIIMDLILEGTYQDKITITNADGVNVLGEGVTVDFGNATSSTTSIVIPESDLDNDSRPYTFTSSVAKALDNTSNNYSKTLTLTKSTETVFVFPSITETDKSNMLYWYGNEFEDVTGGWVIDGYVLRNANGSINALRSLTKNTNSFYDKCTFVNTSVASIGVLGTNNIIDKGDYSKLYVNAKSGKTFSGFNGALYVSNSKNFNVDTSENIIPITSNDSSDIRSIDLITAQYITLTVSLYYKDREVAYNAVWLE